MTNPKELEGAARVPLWLVPRIALVETAIVLDIGARKPGRAPYQWRQSQVHLSQYLSALERHHTSVVDGEWIDPDSGRPHLACVIANASIMLDALGCNVLVNDLPRRGVASAAMRLYENSKR